VNLRGLAEKVLATSHEGEARTAAHELALAVLDAEAVRSDIAHDVVLHNLIHHPLPWRVERDWTYEVTAADGTIITKCMSHERAMAIIALAEKLQNDLNTPLPEDLP